ncbi:MAG TPA: glycosyltransferase [Thermoanaerobaculia bacterium]|jgi:glycosyltransferase involved in cell wall biosynthesis|nr:glycosyltransferase [Thermoanaerobaculia bacterium]
MIRVLHVIVALTAGGAEAMLAKLVGRMDRTRFESTVVSMTDRGALGDIIEETGTELIALGMRRGFPDPRGFIRLRSLLRERQPDVIQSWMYHADVLTALTCRGTATPFLWNVRCSDMNMGDYSALSALTIRAAAHLSPWPAGIVVNSIAGREYHQRIGYRPRAWYFIPNGFDLTRFRPNAEARREIRAEAGIHEQTPLVGLISRFDPMKDHAGFFEAAAMVARRTGAHFLLAGAGVEESNAAICRLFATPDLQGRVHLLGYRGDVDRMMAALDVNVLSSAYGEGFPNVIGEAMASGTICVTTDAGDAGMIVGDCGYVVPPREPAALADAITAALHLPAGERLALERKSRQRIEEHFSVDAVVRQYQDLYEAITRGTAS